MSCSHPLASIVVALQLLRWANATWARMFRKFPTRNVGDNRKPRPTDLMLSL
jgi:hypothetical protein